MESQRIAVGVERHPFFKGCTRPAMFARVPLVPFLLVTGIFLLLGMWSFYLVSPYATLVLAMAYFPLYAVMRAMTRKDDQRLRQLLLRARMRLRHGNRPMWGAISFSAIRLAKRK